MTSGVLVGTIAGGLTGVRLLWPAATVTPGARSLAHVQIAPFGERVAAAAVVIRSGHWIDASVRNGRLEPTDRLAAGSKVTVEVTVHRSGWLGWLLGPTEHVRAVVKTPTALPAARLLYPAAGRLLAVVFDTPVAAVSVRLGSGRRRVLRVSPRRRIVPIGIRASGANVAGTALVSGVPHLWERLPTPVRVSWFPLARTPEVLVRPRPQATLAPTAPIVLTFSQPVSSVLGARRPTLWPQPTGSWHEPNDHTLVFQPTGLGFPLGSHIHIGLKRVMGVLGGASTRHGRTLSWSVPTGSIQRLEELLGQLGYLPLIWESSGDRLPQTASALARAAIAPLAGDLRWRYRPPPGLQRLWESAAGRAVLIRGALMAFESANGLTTDGVPNPAVWRALLADELTRKASPYGYSYVFVTETTPETLTLWHNGHVVLRTPVNTGIPAAPTALGTYPVYLHLSVTTMKGTNPDGSHYADPGVPWVNYFNGGDAVHGFVRPGYGYPQSLGCVEAPISTAAEIWPLVQVGTLVTIAA